MGAGAVVGVAWTVGACSDSGGNPVAGALVDYAEGDWDCELDAPSFDAGSGPIEVEATVSADGDTSGDFTFEIVGAAGAAGPPAQTGDWELDGTTLKLEIPDLPARYTVQGAELDTDGLEIQEHAEGADLQEVDVSRDGDTVTFGWSHPNTGDDVSMDCVKA